MAKQQRRDVAAHAEVKRVGKFGVVGILNTVIDFALYDLLHYKFGLSLVTSNIFSTTCAMLFSFFANKHVVFKQERGSVVKQAVIFFAVTAFGLYVIQTGLIHVLIDVWTWPVDLGLAVAHLLGIQHILTDDFMRKNGAKAIATIFSLTWNYVMYKKVVFRNA